MTEIPQSVLDQFFSESGVKSLVLNDYGFTSQLSPHGDFNTYTGKELAVYRLAVLLSIMEGTYINDPNLGINLMAYIYKPLTDDIVSLIETELRDKINTYEKDLSLLSIEIMKDTATKSVYFKLFLKYTPSDEDITLDFDFVKSIQALIVRSR